jgi:hypothetical protein
LQISGSNDENLTALLELLQERNLYNYDLRDLRFAVKEIENQIELENFEKRLNEGNEQIFFENIDQLNGYEFEDFLKTLFWTLKTDQRVEFRRRRKVWNTAVFVGVCRKADGDHVIVISSEQSGRILLEYGMRWEIETLFGILKTRGFRLEDTHLTDAARVSKLLSLLTLAGCWALLAGEFESAETPIKIKKHGRAEKSIFRLGFDTLRNCFCRIQINLGQKQRFQQLTFLLSCT